MNSILQRGVTFECPQCGQEMINTSEKFSSCPDGHGKLFPHINPEAIISRKIRRLAKAEWLGMKKGKWRITGHGEKIFNRVKRLGLDDDPGGGVKAVTPSGKIFLFVEQKP